MLNEYRKGLFILILYDVLISLNGTCSINPYRNADNEEDYK